MPDYRLFHYKHDHIERADILSAADDLDAIRRSSKMASDGVAELWRGAECVTIFNAPAPVDMFVEPSRADLSLLLPAG
ncbi:hypothetical protein [Sphingosinicella sp. BN140058]|uniref:hypothetical protein n=1 Tax=Sphingosinicella sp. BN140058 TaxID=1892855 RepID=UPI001012B0D1|nr:hypothetical protein [Sphingosinicella sp. BN140058]QAY75984.1 hypothetical protein ETR14_05170 [Sphingosinicella sp. BN140058]